MPFLPEPLKAGDTIGLITPSSPMFQGRLESGIAYLEQKGFKVKLGAHLHDSERFLAGRDEDRAKDIMNFFRDGEVKALMATGGGYGSQRLLPLLDYKIIRANPKIITGFSDTTALQLGLLSKTGLSSCSGFVFRDLDNGALDPLIDKTLLACLTGESYTISEGTPVHPGVIEAPLIGGNLALINALMGTPYQPNYKGCILIIEEAGPEPYQIDCALSQLELAGVFEQISGIIFGQFDQCESRHFPERDGTINDVIQEWSTRIKKPCLINFPYGHADRRCVLPIGKTVRLNANISELTII